MPDHPGPEERLTRSSRPRSADAWRLERVQWIPAPLEEVFAFFRDPWNLERITPPLLRFRIVTRPPIEIRSGALIDYRLRVHGLPVRWRTRIERYDPPHSFVDIQLSGPYRRWVHLHTFRSHEGGTEMTDCVDYAIGFGPIGPLAHRLFVRSALEEIFDFRAREIDRIFGGEP